MPPTWTACTIRTGTIPTAGGVASAACAPSNCRYYENQPWMVFPAGQHLMRLEIDATPPSNVCTEWFTNLNPEFAFTWSAGTQYATEFTANTSAAWFKLVLNWSGVPSWFEGATFRVYFKNAPTEAACAPPAPCVPELAAPGTFLYYLTPALVDAVLIEFGIPWAAPFFTALYFTTYDAKDLCSGLPPPVPTVSLETFHWGFDDIYALFHSLAWWYFCQCAAATPPSVEPPKPPVVQPPGMPTVPTFPCDPAALCASLVAIQKLLAALAQTVGADYQMDTLTQRYSVPFGAIPGATHSSLTGGGTIAVDRLVGILITWTAGDPAAVWEGTPAYFKDLGWVSANDGGAMLIESRVTRQQQIWMPRHMQLATNIGYFAKPGIELAIQELLPEP